MDMLVRIYMGRLFFHQSAECIELLRDRFPYSFAVRYIYNLITRFPASVDILPLGQIDMQSSTNFRVLPK